MRISRSDWANWVDVVQKCLNIVSYCTLCARPSTSEADLCDACRKQFCGCHRHTYRNGIVTSLCLGCGDEYAIQESTATVPAPLVCTRGADSPDRDGFCNACQSRSHPLFSRVIAPYRYTHPVDQLIKRIKYRDDRQLARVFGTLLGNAVQQHVDTSLPQVLLPMPLHAARMKQRGYNQAHDIAVWAGRHLGVPVAAGQVRRIVDTGSLAGLSRLERQHRILGAFRANDALIGKQVAIVDDVLTTGASARELARELYDSGTESVELWVLARTSSLRSGV